MTNPDFPVREVLEHLKARSSVGGKHLTFPVPEREHYLEAVRVALRQPDHLGLHPCRVAIIEDLEKLGKVLARGAESLGATPAEAEKAEAKAKKAPGLLAFIVNIDKHHPKVPQHEQWMTCGAFAASVLNALELQGFAGKIVSGSSTAYPEVTAALCNPGEQVACWLMIGTAKADEKHSDDEEAPDAEAFLSVWA